MYIYINIYIYIYITNSHFRWTFPIFADIEVSKIGFMALKSMQYAILVGEFDHITNTWWSIKYPKQYLEIWFFFKYQIDQVPWNSKELWKNSMEITWDKIVVVIYFNKYIHNINIIPYVKLTEQLPFRIDFSRSGPTYRDVRGCICAYQIILLLMSWIAMNSVIRPYETFPNSCFWQRHFPLTVFNGYI